MSASTLLLLAGLTALAVVGARFGFGNREHPGLLRPLVDNGVAFLLLGAAIGPAGFNLFTQEMVGNLEPLIVIGLGWIGFLYGSHFEWRRMARFSTRYYLSGFSQALLTFGLVTTVSWWMLLWWLGTSVLWWERAAAAIILGICAAGTAPAGVFHLTSRLRLRPADLNLLRFVAAVDTLPGLVLLGVVDAFLHPLAEGSVLLALGWLAVTVGLGALLGLVTHWLFPGGENTRHNSLVMLGVVSLGAGSASLLHLSPLFVTAFAGMLFANLSPRKESAYGVLAGREHDLYTVFLLLAGLLFRLDLQALLILGPAFLLARGAGKVLGGLGAVQFFLPDRRVQPLIGTGLLFQGGMALVMAISFAATQGSDLVQQVVSVVLGAVVVNELLGPVVAARSLRRRGA